MRLIRYGLHRWASDREFDFAVGCCGEAYNFFKCPLKGECVACSFCHDMLNGIAFRQDIPYNSQRALNFRFRLLLKNKEIRAAVDSIFFMPIQSLADIPKD
jgi:hypothetical protein